MPFRYKTSRQFFFPFYLRLYPFAILLRLKSTFIRKTSNILINHRCGDCFSLSLSLSLENKQTKIKFIFHLKIVVYVYVVVVCEGCLKWQNIGTIERKYTWGVLLSIWNLNFLLHTWNIWFKSRVDLDYFIFIMGIFYLISLKKITWTLWTSTFIL